MRKRYMWLLAVLAVLLLSACGGKTGVSEEGQPSETVPPSAVEENQVQEQEEPAEQMDETLLYETYIDIEKLPVLCVDMASEAVFDDRRILLEDSIDNELELAAYQYQYYCASAEFDKLMELVGEHRALQIATENEEKNFQDGLYMSERRIHTLTTLSREDMGKAMEFGKEDILAKIDAFGFEEYGVVRMEIGLKHNEKSLSMGPQIGDGDYVRYYLFARTQKEAAFKMYEVYWDDFLDS